MRPKWRLVGNLGRHIGQHSSILAPFWRDLGNLGDKMSPKRSPNGAPDAIQLASWAILAPRGSPKCSKTAPKLDFLEFSTDLDTILDAFSLIVHLHLNQIFTSILPSMFLCSCSISHMNLKLQPLAWHSGGFARAAHWSEDFWKVGAKSTWSAAQSRKAYTIFFWDTKLFSVCVIEGSI